MSELDILRIMIKQHVRCPNTAELMVSSLDRVTGDMAAVNGENLITFCRIANCETIEEVRAALPAHIGGHTETR